MARQKQHIGARRVKTGNKRGIIWKK